MSAMTRRPGVDVLKGLNRLSELSSYQLKDLSRRLEVFRAPRGSRLMELGNTEDTTLFLVSGKVELTATDGNTVVIESGSRAARDPLCRLRPSRYAVTAASPVEYIVADNDVLEEYLPFEEGSSLLIDNNYIINEPGEFGGTAEGDRLAQQVFEDLQSNRLAIPSLPHIAERVGRAVLAAGEDERILAQALMADPVMTIKAIRAVNSRLPASDSPVTTCVEAVRRLGPERAVSLVVNNVLRETLRSRNPVILEQMERWWERSVRISAVCYVLARLSERFDPDLAALAGLAYNIGEPVVLGYAEAYPELVGESSLAETLDRLAPEIGRVVLTMWNLSHELVTAASESRNWLRDHQHPADYADMVLVAQLLVIRGEPGTRHLPRADQVPAYHRLGLHDVSREFNVHVEKAARGAVAQTEEALVA